MWHEPRDKNIKVLDLRDYDFSALRITPLTRVPKPLSGMILEEVYSFLFIIDRRYSLTSQKASDGSERVNLVYCTAETTATTVCIMYGHTYSKSTDQPGKVANTRHRCLGCRKTKPGATKTTTSGIEANMNSKAS